MNPRPSLSRRRFLRSAGATTTAASAAAWIAAPTSTARTAATDNPWAYNVEHLRRTDPALLRYEPVGSFLVSAAAPRRITWGPDQLLHVAADRSILSFSPTGEPAGAHSLDAPACAIQFAPDGSRWIAFRDHVQVHDPDRTLRARWPAFPGRPFLTGLALAPDHAYVADSGNRVVYRCSLQGKIEGRIGEKNPDRHIPGLVLPSPFLDVELGGDGLLRINNPGRHRVELYTPEGDLELSWGSPGTAIESFCGCCNPINLALLPDGSCLTAEKGLSRIKIYHPDGRFEGVVAGPDPFTSNASATRSAPAQDLDALHDGLDVAVAADLRVAVLDIPGRAIHIFRRKPAV